MSHIFDALQRSESDREGTESPSFSVATELLRHAEEKMRKPGAAGKQHTKAEANDYLLPAVDEELQNSPLLTPSIPSENRLVSTGKEDSLGAEKFRFLAVRLRQMRQSRPLKKILITSTIPEEGKSTVAANLACTLARRKPHKVLLIDGDLRRPTESAQFGIGNVPGLCEWLSGETEEASLYRLEGLGMWILPAGVAPENPLELMQSGKLGPLLERLDTWFDWIVIDSPPVLPLADTSIWSRLADGILLVTRKGVTEKRQLQRGLEAIEKSKLLGALVNSSVNVSHSDYYQRYSYYGDRSKKG